MFRIPLGWLSNNASKVWFKSRIRCHQSDTSNRTLPRFRNRSFHPSKVRRTFYFIQVGQSRLKKFPSKRRGVFRPFGARPPHSSPSKLDHINVGRTEWPSSIAFSSRLFQEPSICWFIYHTTLILKSFSNHYPSHALITADCIYNPFVDDVPKVIQGLPSPYHRDYPLERCIHTSRDPM